MLQHEWLCGEMLSEEQVQKEMGERFVLLQEMSSRS
jgi:hypothetical protein